MILVILSAAKNDTTKARGTMITLYLVRHGESVYNAEGRIQGHQDVGLSELGIRQAELIADRLASVEFDAVYSSDLVRASATAEIIAARHDLPVQTTPLLREAMLGVIEGLTRAEVDERYPAGVHIWRERPLSARPPGAESVVDLIERARAFLEETLPKHPDGSRLLIVGHGGSLRGVIIAGLDLSAEFYHRMHFSNANLSIIELGERPAFRLFNDTCHLDSMRTDEDEIDSLAH